MNKSSHLGCGGCQGLLAPFKHMSEKQYSGPWKGHLCIVCLFSAWLILDP